jgi:hypothetical protein
MVLQEGHKLSAHRSIPMEWSYLVNCYSTAITGVEAGNSASNASIYGPKRMYELSELSPVELWVGRPALLRLSAINDIDPRAA